jgi:hypothetical protein
MYARTRELVVPGPRPRRPRRIELEATLGKRRLRRRVPGRRGPALLLLIVIIVVIVVGAGGQPNVVVVVATLCLFQFHIVSKQT